MVLPLMAVGPGILGGESFLMGKYNERKAERGYDQLERDINNSSFAGTADGHSMLNFARSQMDEAGFMDWGEGAPNDFLDSMREGLFQHGLNQSAQQQQAEAAARASAPGQAIQRGDYLAQQWHAENSKDIDAQYATQGLLDVLERGDSASYAQSMLMWAQSMGMGALQGPDQRIVEGVGGVPSWFARAFNGLVDGTGKTWTQEDAKEIANAVKTAWNPRYQRMQRAKSTYSDLWQNAQRRYQSINEAANVPTPFRYGSGPMDESFEWQGGSSEQPGPVTDTRRLPGDFRDSVEQTYKSVEDLMGKHPGRFTVIGQ